MSMNDPGWDDAGFDAGGHDSWNDTGTDTGAGTEAAGDRTGGRAGGGGGRPPVYQQPWFVAAAGAVVLVVIVVLAVVLISNKHSSTSTAATTGPTASHPTTAAGSSTAGSTSASSSPSPTKTMKPIVTIADFAQGADAVCTAYKPKVIASQKKASPSNLSPIISTFTAEIKRLEKVPLPTRNPGVAQKWFQKDKEALADLKAHNVNAFNSSILDGDTYAGKLGMHVCNYGH